MRARGALLLLALIAGSAFADEPKPKVEDVKAIRDKLILLEDPHGGVYVVYRGAALDEARVWFGTNKIVYEQIIHNRRANGETGAWGLSMWTPRMSGIDPSVIQRNNEGGYERYCGGGEKGDLKLVPADRAKPILEKLQFNSSGIIHVAHLLARDDTGVYYYVDTVMKEYGGHGERVFSGKKGAMKELPLTDVANDSGGEVYSTKSGDIRFVFNASGDHAKDTASWIKGEKKHDLVLLDIPTNSRLIYYDLGIYPFLGTPCDEL